MRVRSSSPSSARDTVVVWVVALMLVCVLVFCLGGCMVIVAMLVCEGVLFGTAFGLMKLLVVFSPCLHSSSGCVKWSR